MAEPTLAELVREQFRKIECGGQRANRKKQARRIPKWPIASDSAAVHPSQIETFNRVLHEGGCRKTGWTKDGRPILHSEEHKREFAKARWGNDIGWT